MVAAGSLITAGTKIPPRTLVVGTPGKVLRELREDEWRQGRQLAARYVEVAKAHRQS
jgi:carbonic anhydrase/acetyltransferase-like protein (isoleucine patch superfamily)